MEISKLNLPAEKFNKIVRQSRRLTPRRCVCGSSASVKIHFAFYGPVGVRVECNACNRSGEMQRITEPIGTENKFGTPITEKALMKGIKNAIVLWNNTMRERMDVLNE